MNFLPGWMPASVKQALFPVVVTTNTGAGDTNAVGSHTINLPGSIVAGNLLVIVAGIGSASALTYTISGFSQLLSSTGTNTRLIIWTKTAAGSEGATITMSSSANVAASFTSYQISGWLGIEAAATNGSGANPNPPNLTPTWATTKTLWLAAQTAFTTVGNSLSVSTYPSSFTNGIQSSWSIPITPGGSTGSAQLASEVGSMDPGTFALSTGSGVTWVAGTIGIRPN